MADWVALAKRFDYDLWANSLWLDCLYGKNAADCDRDILAHVLGASQAWLLRCRGEAPTSIPKVPLSKAEMERLGLEWRDVMAPAQDRIIRFKRFDGNEYELPISEIVEHVINHGTYHRGELRGLCRSRNDEDFPETDYVKFLLGTK